jgi:uncharacterized membrane protein YphA (DoxX/SURF4 family)
VERYLGWIVAGARLLVAVVFLLNGFGIIDQTLPAREMLERGVPAGIVQLAMFAGRTLEIVAGFGLVLGIFPRLCAAALFAFLVPATFVSHSFWLAAGLRSFKAN